MLGSLRDPRRIVIGMCVGLAGVVTACGGGGDGDGGPTPPTQQGSIAIAAAPASVPLVRGGNGTVALTLTRAGGFAGAVALSVEGAPAGVTATFAPSNVAASATSSALTLSASAAAATGTATLTIRASGTGVTAATTTVQVVVSAAPAGALGVAVNPTTLPLVAGQGTGTVAVQITRPAGFTTGVTLTASGQPAGLLASFQPQPATGQTSTLTITAGGTVPAGTYPITVRASADGVTAGTATLTVTVTAPVQGGPFQLELSAPSYLALAGTILQSQPIITVRRDPGFTGPVTLSVVPLNVLVIVGVTPTNVTGDRSTVVVFNAGAPAGTYPVTIKGVGGGGERTVTMNVVVAPPSTGAIRWQVCGGLRYPMWFFALKDGDGPWTRLVPELGADSVYNFDVRQQRAQLAMVHLDSGVTRTTVYQYTKAEIEAAARNECALYPLTTNRRATGSVIGLVPGEMAMVAMGGWQTSTLGGGWSVQNLPPGPLDLFAVKSRSTAVGVQTAVSAVLRRGANPPAGGATPFVDFNGAEPFQVQAATWRFGNTGGEAFTVHQTFHTAGGTAGQFTANADLERAETARGVFSVPAAQTVDGDLNQVVATIGTYLPNRPSRQIVAYGRTFGDRDIDFGPVLPMPTVTAVPGAPAGRLRAQGTLPAEYAAGVAFDFKSNGQNPRFFSIYATRDFLGTGSSYDVQLPDFSAAIGWDTNWQIRPGDRTDWWVSGGGPVIDATDGRQIFNVTRVRWAGAQTGITLPSDGAVYRMGRQQGSVVP